MICPVCNRSDKAYMTCNRPDCTELACDGLGAATYERHDAKVAKLEARAEAAEAKLAAAVKALRWHAGDTSSQGDMARAALAKIECVK